MARSCPVRGCRAPSPGSRYRKCSPPLQTPAGSRPSIPHRAGFVSHCHYHLSLSPPLISGGRWIPPGKVRPFEGAVISAPPAFSSSPTDRRSRSAIGACPCMTLRRLSEGGEHNLAAEASWRLLSPAVVGILPPSASRAATGADDSLGGPLGDVLHTPRCIVSTSC